MAKNPAPSAVPNSWANLIFQLYLAGVCGFSLIVGTFSAAGLLTSGLDLAIPPSISVAETRWDDITKADVPRSAEEVARDRVNQAITQRENSQREAAHSTIYLLLGLLVFGFHWRLFKARKE